MSGINPDALGRIESGKVIPKYETLEYLSSIYRLDLNDLLLKYRIDDFSAFYNIKTRLENKFDNDEFYTLETEVKKLEKLTRTINSAYYMTYIKQLILLTKAVILYKNYCNNNEALNKLISAIKLTIPDFVLDKYTTFVYSSLEIRILMNIAFVLNRLNNKNRYLEIMEFCINEADSGDEIYPKLCHNLAGAYRRNKDYNRALDFSQKGIIACQQKRSFSGLSLLYYGKGIAEFKLNRNEYLHSLKTSIMLCEAFGQYELKNTIINNCKEVFGIKMSTT